MKLFPGVDTHTERKRFAVFHTCTLVLCPLIVMLIMFLVFSNHGDPHNNPFDAGMGKWLLLSLFTWNVLGAWRFVSDFGPLAGRMVGILLFLGFPLFYLHNFWRMLVNKDKS